MSHDTDFSPDRAIDNRQTASAGLSSSEARARLEQYGFNAVSWQSSGDAGWSDGYVAWYRKFVWGALLVAAGASVVLMHLADGVLLFALLAVGGLFAFDERRKTAARIADIEEETALRAQVLRDGKRQHVEIDLLVPGDVVYLEKNDRAFADMRLIEAENFWVLKTPIEGAGVPLQRIADAEIRVGEVVVQGNARAIVVRTGERTLAGGAAAGSFPRESEATPLQRTLWRIRRSHGILALSAFWAVVAAGIIQFRDISEIVLIGVCLLVAALPESVFSLALSVLAREMRNARSLGIVFYRPLAIEKLAMANVVCTQKTGILTKGEMSLVAMTSAGEASPDGDWEREILKAALICCDTDLQDPVDAAIVSAARERGIRVEDEQNGRNGQKALFVDEVPFDSSRHLKTVLIRTDSGYRVYSRGAPEELLLSCADSPALYGARESFDTLASEGRVVVGVAYKDLGADALPPASSAQVLECGMTFLGVLAFEDPLNEGIPGEVALCDEAGIQTLLLTGDYAQTAYETGRQIGIVHDRKQVVTGRELRDMGKFNLWRKIDRYGVFARMMPEHRIWVVEALHRKGAVVVATGKSIEDVETFSAADVGCCIGSSCALPPDRGNLLSLSGGTFGALTEAISIARTAVDRVRKPIKFFITCNMAEIILLLVAVLFNLDTPLLPQHVFLLNFLLLPLLAISLSYEAPEWNVMSREPYDLKGGLLLDGEGVVVGLQALVLAGLALAALHLGFREAGKQAQTMCFATLGFGAIVQSWNVRFDLASVLNRAFGRNGRNLLASLVCGAVLAALLLLPELGKFFHLVPLTVHEWQLVIVLALSALPIVEIAKSIKRRIP